MEADGRESERRDTLDPLFTWSLLPFFGSSALYLLLWLPIEEPSWNSALARCLAILYLALFVHNIAPAGSYGRFICVGLLCSALGDIVLTWPNHVVFGMATFALAHLFYVTALGWHPIRQTVLESVVAVTVLYFGLLQPHLPSSLSLPVLAYAVILGLMLWRALVRGSFAAFGGLFFSISDALQAWDTFWPLLSGRLITKITYYAAQALLSLSALEGGPDPLAEFVADP